MAGAKITRVDNDSPGPIAIGGFDHDGFHGARVPPGPGKSVGVDLYIPDRRERDSVYHQLIVGTSRAIHELYFVQMEVLTIMIKTWEGANARRARKLWTGPNPRGPGLIFELEINLYWEIGLSLQGEL